MHHFGGGHLGHEELQGRVVNELATPPLGELSCSEVTNERYTHLRGLRRADHALDQNLVEQIRHEGIDGLQIPDRHLDQDLGLAVAGLGIVRRPEVVVAATCAPNEWSFTRVEDLYLRSGLLDDIAERPIPFGQPLSTGDRA
jgi:hypothetical protein